MKNLGAKEAADAIRGAFLTDRSVRADPREAHQMKFAREVVRELGGDDSPETVRHVMQLLREHDIELHAGHEFPKYATRKWDRTAKIVHSEDEEQAWVNEEQPAPLNQDDLPAARTLDAPVQDLSLDLRNKVPHMVGDEPQPERTPRIPSAITNREAAQDAYARQPNDRLNRDTAAVAYDRANPGLDHQNQNAAQGEGEFTNHDGTDIDDDEVHVEDLAPNSSPRRPAGNRRPE